MPRTFQWHVCLSAPPKPYKRTQLTKSKGPEPGRFRLQDQGWGTERVKRSRKLQIADKLPKRRSASGLLHFPAENVTATNETLSNFKIRTALYCRAPKGGKNWRLVPLISGTKNWFLSSYYPFPFFGRYLYNQSVGRFFTPFVRLSENSKSYFS